MGILEKAGSFIRRAFSRGEEARPPSRGERMFSQLLGWGGSLGWTGNWSSDRTLQVQRYRGWSYVAIKAIAEEIAGHPPKVAYIRQPADLDGDGEDDASNSDPSARRRKAWRARHRVPFAERRKSLASLQSNEELEAVGRNHPLNRLLRKPNPLDTQWSFWYRTVLYLELTGNNYWWKIYNEDGIVRELWVLPSQWVWPIRGGADERITTCYEIRPYGMGITSGRWLRLEPDAIIEFQYPGAVNPLDGQSPLQSIAPWVDSSDSVDAFRWATFKNGMAPKGVFTMPAGTEDPSQQDLNALRAKLESLYISERNAGRFVLAPPGLEFQDTEQKPSEMSFLESGDQLRDWQMAGHRVSKSMAGIDDSMTYNSMVASKANFIISTIKPKLLLIDQVMTEHLAQPLDEDLVIYHDDPAPEEPDHKLAKWTTALDKGGCSPNEFRREILGVEPYAEGGDDPLVASTLGVMPLQTGQQLGDDDVSAAAIERWGNRGEGGGLGGRSPKQSDDTSDPDAPPPTPGNATELEQTPARAELLSTVGGIQGAIDILGKLSEGTITRESAVQLMILFFGMDVASANRLIGETGPKGPDIEPPVTPQPSPPVKSFNGHPRFDADRELAVLAGPVSKATITLRDFRRAMEVDEPQPQLANGHAKLRDLLPALTAPASEASFGTLPSGRTVQYVRHDASPPDEMLLMVDPRKLDAAWSANVIEYLPADGVASVDDERRRQGIVDFLATGKPLQASRVLLDGNGCLAFTDGRHRFAVLRDDGIDRVGIMVQEGQAAEFRQRFSPGATAFAPPESKAATFNEADHPRGQTGNPGQFGSGGGSKPSNGHGSVASGKPKPSSGPKGHASKPTVVSPGAKFIGQAVGHAEHAHADKVSSSVAQWVGGVIEEDAGGPGQKDKKPFDVRAKKRGGGCHDIEVKSLLKGGKTSISVHEDALLRKVEHMAANPDNEFHTVAVDERATYDGGKYKENYSGHPLYYKRGSGRYSLSQMYPVKDERELRKLIALPADQLPDAAKGQLPPPPPIDHLREVAERASQSRKNRDRIRKERNKDLLRAQARARVVAQRAQRGPR